ncbi:hypothetical protein ACH5RR_029024 [Cinchona calisaya]|uniref:Uncharacterized protein n=1 Tax=Cinchona calisaya TaxID=153742 RepID=A0ABD2YQJ0_9GENT
MARISRASNGYLHKALAPPFPPITHFSPLPVSSYLFLVPRTPNLPYPIALPCWLNMMDGKGCVERAKRKGYRKGRGKNQGLKENGRATGGGSIKNDVATSEGIMVVESAGDESGGCFF